MATRTDSELLVNRRTRTYQQNTLKTRKLLHYHFNPRQFWDSASEAMLTKFAHDIHRSKAACGLTLPSELKRIGGKSRQVLLERIKANIPSHTTYQAVTAEIPLNNKRHRSERAFYKAAASIICEHMRQN